MLLEQAKATKARSMTTVDDKSSLEESESEPEPTIESFKHASKAARAILRCSRQNEAAL